MDDAKKHVKKIAQKNKTFSKKERLTYLEQLNKIKTNKKNILKLKISKKKSSLLIRFKYTRFANNWILITNKPQKIIREIKENFTHWLDNNLAFKLDPEKALKTDLKKEKSKFLGFTL